MIKNCRTCKHRVRLPGDAHISCDNPADTTAVVKNVKNKDINKTVEVILETVKNHYRHLTVVVRRIWKDSGRYPFCYDPSTVLGCSNYEKREV